MTSDPCCLIGCSATLDPLAIAPQVSLKTPQSLPSKEPQLAPCIRPCWGKPLRKPASSLPGFLFQSPLASIGHIFMTPPSPRLASWIQHMLIKLGGSEARVSPQLSGCWVCHQVLRLGFSRHFWAASNYGSSRLAATAA